MNLTLPLNDVFGPTIQGEGPYMGHVVNFIRLGLCNLHCTNCDTKQTWDKDNYDLKVENPDTEAQEIFDRLEALKSYASIVVISGGEPLMHQDRAGFRWLLRELVKNNFDVHIETNGTRLVRPVIADLIAHFSVSPKITSALTSPRDERSKRIRMGTLREYAHYVKQGKACFKIVCANTDDVDEAMALCSELNCNLDDFWIMPMGETAGTLDYSTRKVLERTLEHGMCFSPRLHILTGVK